MDVRNCKKCTKLFNYLGGQPLCPECIKELDVKFDEVKAYVYDHPRESIQVVSEACEVSVAQIKRWVREERLAFSDESQVGLECESCGRMVRTGRFCEACKDKMAKSFESVKPKAVLVEPQKKKSESPRMRFLDSL